MMELTPDNVTSLTQRCMANSGEPTKGIIHSFICDPAAIEQNKPEIGALLMQLPDSFMASKGGGMSFLSMCERRDGTLWSGMHLTMESLVVLGIAAGFVSFNFPRELDPALPGGMPYIAVNDKLIEEMSA